MELFTPVNYLKFKGIALKIETIDFALNSIAKLGMPCGLWCYSVPQILSKPEFYKSLRGQVFMSFIRFIASALQETLDCFTFHQSFNL